MTKIRYILFVLLLCFYYNSEGNGISIKKDSCNAKKYFYEFGIGGSKIGPLVNASFGINSKYNTSLSFQIMGSKQVYLPTFNTFLFNRNLPCTYFVSAILLYGIKYKKFKFSSGIDISNGLLKTNNLFYTENRDECTFDRHYRYINYIVIGGRLNFQYLFKKRIKKQNKTRVLGINIFGDYNPQSIQHGVYLNWIF